MNNNFQVKLHSSSTLFKFPNFNKHFHTNIYNKITRILGGSLRQLKLDKQTERIVRNLENDWFFSICVIAFCVETKTLEPVCCR